MSPTSEPPPADSARIADPLRPATGRVRRAVVAGTFYPADAEELAKLVADCLAEAHRRSATKTGTGLDVGSDGLAGLMVPHAGLVYSGVVAAAGWRLLGRGSGAGASAAASTGPTSAGPTVVLLGTNHRAPWFKGVGLWDGGPWRTPLGVVEVDADLAVAIGRLGRPFVVEPAAHAGEHSIEVQLPFIQAVRPGSRIVPLTVATGTGAAAREAGVRLGELLAARRSAGDRILLAISSDMAHYPPATACAQVIETMLPYILRCDSAALADEEVVLARANIPGLACGMCGIEAAVLGLSALSAMGAGRGTWLDSATSADAGGPRDRTVGYLSVGFPG